MLVLPATLLRRGGVGEIEIVWEIDHEEKIRSTRQNSFEERVHMFV